jgi:hypothetical protein
MGCNLVRDLCIHHDILHGNHGVGLHDRASRLLYHDNHLDQSYLERWFALEQPFGRDMSARNRKWAERKPTFKLRPWKTLSFKTRAWATRLGSVNSTYAYLHILD